jgi:hypothetical protein
MGKKRNTYSLLVGKPEGKRPLRGPSWRWVDNIRIDRLCGLVVRVLDYRFGGPGSIPRTTKFSEKKRKKKENSSGSGTGSTQLYQGAT